MQLQKEAFSKSQGIIKVHVERDQSLNTKITNKTIESGSKRGREQKPQVKVQAN